ncbi:hypothetical protein EVAR_82705_1 [Eumeta japonica]|uniref:Uncharacterized protein n=1 Tax=Eumeta variegata TaxID=151549 RepID=A0A4C1YCQ1_EUMVA|nr:hypothetical protein EVAR_82705_1 [Eumeta japonica]
MSKANNELKAIVIDANCPNACKTKVKLFRRRDRSPLVQSSYCVSVFLRVAFRSVGLRECMSVCDPAQYTSRSDSYVCPVCPKRPTAFVPLIRSGLPHRLYAEPVHGFCA